MTDTWQIFDLETVKSGLDKSNSASFKDFLIKDSMTCGIYHLAKGAKDMQTPHDEDEIYYVLEGRARLQVGDREMDVHPVMLLFVTTTKQTATTTDLLQTLFLDTTTPSHPGVCCRYY